jgi:chemotaxis family two-component system sensor histidine kinase/response regulator PixL
LNQTSNFLSAISKSFPHLRTMAIDSDIRDQAYQFFIQEAPELLAVIEAELLTLKAERNTAKVHSLMRAAHSLKGGSACVGLETIKTLAHRLEDIFKALHSEELKIDSDLESLLLQAYDCLRLPLMQQIRTGQLNTEQALAAAEPVFAKIEAQLKDYLGGESFLPSSVELGFDIALSIFEVDVAQELDRLSAVLANPQNTPIAGELRAQAEVFTGIAELLSLPGLGAIAQTTLTALEAHPDQAMQIAQLALADFRAAQAAVIAGDRTQGGSPSLALKQLAIATPDTESTSEESTFSSWEDFFGETPLTPGTEELAPLVTEDEFISHLEPLTLDTLEFSSLNDFLGDSELSSDELLDPLATEEQLIDELAALTPELESNPALNNFLEFPELTAIEEVNPLLSEVADIPSVNPAESVVAIVLVPQPETPAPILSVDEVLALAASKPKRQELPQSEAIEIQPLSELSETNLIIQEATFTSDTSLEDIFSPAISSPEILEEIPAFVELAEVKIASDISLETHEPTGLVNPEYLSHAIPSLEDIFGGSVAQDSTTDVTEIIESLNSTDLTLIEAESEPLTAINIPEISGKPVAIKAPENIQDLLQSVEQVFDSLPGITELPATPTIAEKTLPTTANLIPKEDPIVSKATKKAAEQEQAENSHNSAPNLSVRVDIERLERMNNLVGELAINRNGLSLQNEQLQTSVQELLRRFAKFQDIAHHLRDLSDQMLVAPERYRMLQTLPTFAEQKVGENRGTIENLAANSSALIYSGFDSLEMDSYGELHSLLQTTLEEVVQLEEIVGDVSLLAGQSSQTLEGQRQMLTHLRDDLMWARMLPLGEVLSRFPRTLRDLSNTYKKSVNLKLVGTGVLVDKAALEKLYDPLLHLLRNAFDHGIESPEVRRQQGKSEQGQIEIRAYHQGSQTVIEVRDDGQGVNWQRLRDRVVELGLLSSTQIATTANDRLLDFLFEPGFSTATQVSELSGRGVGLDVVRSQLRSLKGTVTVTSTLGKGTTFTLRIPLTLTISKLLVCLVGSTAYALPSDSIEEILIPKADQLKKSGKQRFLHWRQQIVPVYHLSELLNYACPLPESIPSQALVAVPTPEAWAPPMLLIRQDQQFMALEIDRLVTEQELVIKPFGSAIAPPSYIYGCTILGDGSLIPVIDSPTLLDQLLGQGKSKTSHFSEASILRERKATSTGKPQTPINPVKSSLLLVVDDSIALRQTLALTLQKAGYRVLQARDGREAIEQLQQNSSIQLVICDVEMPNMNGFEFLNHRRQEPTLSKIPVVMLTSRSSEKHRQLASHLGASAYFTKPYLEQEFLASLKTIVDQEVSVGQPALLSST